MPPPQPLAVACPEGGVRPQRPHVAPGHELCSLPKAANRTTRVRPATQYPASVRPSTSARSCPSTSPRSPASAPEARAPAGPALRHTAAPVGVRPEAPAGPHRHERPRSRGEDCEPQARPDAQQASQELPVRHVGLWSAKLRRPSEPPPSELPHCACSQPRTIQGSKLALGLPLACRGIALTKPDRLDAPAAALAFPDRPRTQQTRST
jgi:hypothetical protein